MSTGPRIMHATVLVRGRRFKQMEVMTRKRTVKYICIHTESTSTMSVKPSREQLRAHFLRAAVPMIGFGFMDNTVMIQAGNAIDCTLGVRFGLSTLTAAAFGQVFSNAVSVIAGGTVEALALRMGLPSPGFTPMQKKLPVVKRTALLGSLFGVIFGCTLGLVNLFFIDADRSHTLKLQASLDNLPSEETYEVEATNAKRPDGTTLTIRGPDRDGLLTSMVSALNTAGCSVVELHASPRHRSSTDSIAIEDIFVVTDQKTKQPFEEDELPRLAKTLLDASTAAHKMKNEQPTNNE
mmetsp:Transcript_21179/g.38226  ORF Transcript_21179/g.38226 Transcript_21179/m.38226 type:complete len:294 (-) Transcript_21179:147-1028(-)